MILMSKTTQTGVLHSREKQHFIGSASKVYDYNTVIKATGQLMARQSMQASNRGSRL